MARATSEDVDVSIVYRALNEEKWFEQSLQACLEQKLDGLTYEIILVDSGSTDRTLEIAEKYDCRIVHIAKSQFTFGRSLNWGCEAARGKYLVLISAHCIPSHDLWLQNLVQPLVEERAEYVYGRQHGMDGVTKFSEERLFGKYFPIHATFEQEGFYVNNANAAIRADVWRERQFDEEVTGLEDMVLGKRIVSEGGRIGYVADAPVYHIHEETLQQVKRRYYREALTLRDIMPEVQVHMRDFMRYFAAGAWFDLCSAARRGKLFSRFVEIVSFRLMQYWGAYSGHNEHRRLSRAQKETYYYPKVDASHDKALREHPTPAASQSTTSTKVPVNQH